MGHRLLSLLFAFIAGGPQFAVGPFSKLIDCSRSAACDTLLRRSQFTIDLHDLSLDISVQSRDLIGVFFFEAVDARINLFCQLLSLLNATLFCT